MTTYERVKFVYDGDYDQWIGMFSQDKTEVN